MSAKIPLPGIYRQCATFREKVYFIILSLLCCFDVGLVTVSYENEEVPRLAHVEHSLRICTDLYQSRQTFQDSSEIQFLN